MFRKETSYGIIPLRKELGKWQVLLIKHQKGHWAFPKGHPEIGEEPKDAAVREFNEETGLHILSFLNIPSLQEHYLFREGIEQIDKTVMYFAAEVAGEISLQEAEIAAFKWLTLEEAQKMATFPEMKSLCAKLLTYFPA